MDGDTGRDFNSSEDPEAYVRLINHLNAAGARYRFIDPAPEGRTELASALRGHDLSHAAKCLVVMVRFGKKLVHYVLAVIPGDSRLDFTALKELFSGSAVAFASTEKAEELAGSASGTILPFSFNPDLELVVDPRVLTATELYFNAARLDRSIALWTEDYVQLTSPRIARIALTT